MPDRVAEKDSSMKAVFRAFLLLVGVAIIGSGIAAYAIASRGLSTRVAPSAIETSIALTMRWLATPSDARGAGNPVPATSEVLEEALAHFADHCATCHANDGSGNIEMGRNFYPPAPDMRAARTQQLSDGELFSIIENGIRLTGMPAWGTGTPDGERGSWGLVHFVRKLPTLTAEDLARMETMNPRSPQAFREEEDARQFLAGEDAPGAPTPQPSHAGHR
jgi:mono/diheme cytochrome c family protein